MISWPIRKRPRKRLELATAKARDGPSRSTRSQKQQGEYPSTSSNRLENIGTSGKIASNGIDRQTDPDEPSCLIDLTNGVNTVRIIGRCNDGSDDTFMSPRVADRAVSQGIGVMNSIRPVKFSVALRKGDKPQMFTFSPSWTGAWIVLQLAPGKSCAGQRAIYSRRR